jgi:cupin fold WbuC family metalloprotein
MPRKRSATKFCKITSRKNSSGIFTETGKMKPELSKIALSDSKKIRVDEGGRSVGFFTKNLPGRVDWELVKELKEAAIRYRNKNVRLCLHDDQDALFHTMIILERKGKFYRPHKHLEKGECFHIIEGRMAVFSFGEEGEIVDSCCLDPEGIFIYRVAINMFHAVIPLTEMVIYHESKPGPFLGRQDSIFPSWAPDGMDKQKAEEYTMILQKTLKMF